MEVFLPPDVSGGDFGPAEFWQRWFCCGVAHRSPSGGGHPAVLPGYHGQRSPSQRLSGDSWRRFKAVSCD
ncbi:hypothetical protein RchiOBHm_Chr5g0055471 [Rosa chinensis]|uniref:Uncharacterized protein n=1 Tax=Rosa chinensis TaxID=74649 RepID=A0A2P6QGF9_ROSCH|nr:hypothetical protein RchiOBHm_Chr5g0055471 [Rosa chinensis]